MQICVCVFVLLCVTVYFFFFLGWTKKIENCCIGLNIFYIFDKQSGIFAIRSLELEASRGDLCGDLICWSTLLIHVDDVHMLVMIKLVHCSNMFWVFVYL